MSERLLEQPAQSVDAVEPQVGTPDAPVSYRERFRHAGERAWSLVDLSAGIALRKGDLKYAAEAQARLDEPFGGLLERQAQDPASLSLQQDVYITFRSDAQKAGFTDVEAMPEELRAQSAERAAQAHITDITTELLQNHPDWAPEEIEAAAQQRVWDISQLLAMNTEQQSAYREASLKYHEINSSVKETQLQLSEMQAERQEGLSELGRAALAGLIAISEKARELPLAVQTRVRVAGMVIAEQFGAWYTAKSPEAKVTFLQTAAGVAVAGIASYIAMRSGVSFGGAGTSHQAIDLMNSSAPLNPDHLGVATPDHLGSSPVAIGASSVDHIGASTPHHIGANLGPDHIGVSAPNHLGASTPDHIGGKVAEPTHIGAAPDHLGSQSGPSHIGAQATPDHIGSNPNHVGGIDLSDAKTSSELFAVERATQWPTSIEVSPWDANTQDGSLWGISRQLLKQSGVQSPNDVQIDLLVDSLRPQAQPNGWLSVGQQLNLQPAIDLLSQITK